MGDTSTLTDQKSNGLSVGQVNKHNTNKDAEANTERAQTTSNQPSSWFSNRTFLEKSLLILLILTLTFSIVMVIYAAKNNSNSTSSGNVSNNVCLTESCIQTSARLLEAMDQSVNPCDDFFEYACGTWNRINVIPDDRSNYNTFGKLRDQLQIILKDLLETPKVEKEVTAIIYAKNLYQSCLNMTLIEERLDAPLQKLLQDLGGWPILDPTWDVTTFDLEKSMAELRVLNNKVLLNQWVSSDDRNSSINIVQLDQTQLGMPSRDYYLRSREDPQLMAYQNLALDVAKQLGAPADTVEADILAMIEFEIKLANITTPEDQRRDTEALYNKYTVRELYTNVTDQLDWHKYLQGIYSNVSMEVTLDDQVILYAPKYMKKLVVLLKDTDNRTIANYMMWRIVMNRVSNLNQKFLDLRRAYNKALYGTDSDRARWRTCVSYVNDNFGMAVGRMFLKEHFDESAKNNALEMIVNIREAFDELLLEVPWMDDDTRKVAKEKANSINEKIGYPDYIMNDTALNIDYTGITSDPDKYFENVLNHLNIAFQNNMKQVALPVDRTRWSTTPAVVNAFYSATKNQIMFPAGILQPPFYSETYPKSIRYGGIGTGIGHEITHGFDDEGRQFDKDGNLKQWWSDDVISRFKGKAQCIIDQYGNYTVPEINLNLNGRQTQGENIADNGGLKQAFKAYRTWVKRQGQEEAPLPGIDLSHDQLFFLNFAQIWCGTARPESYIQAITSGRHSPGRFRVIGTVSNSYDFSKAYNCPIGSNMNPRHKCAVW